jgi:hypothetical protein
MSIVGSGVIGTGQAQYLDVVLQGGHTYAVNVRPSESNVDFDLHILDQNGNVVAVDESTAPDAHGLIRPFFTGPFRIWVNSVQGMAAYQIEVVG